MNAHAVSKGIKERFDVIVKLREKSDNIEERRILIAESRLLIEELKVLRTIFEEYRQARRKISRT